MAWHGIEGHDNLVTQFRAALGRGRLASTFLFVGPSGVGKRTFAEKFAQALLCMARPVEQLDPCEQCDSCRQVLAGAHPDLLRVAKPEGKSELPLALLIGEGETRMRTGLCHDIALKPFMGGRRVAIIDDADDLNTEGANCLLKTLEEPPPRSVIILLGTSAERQLPTIRSRAQLVRFRPLESQQVATILERQGVVSDHETALGWAALSQGSVAKAIEMADAELWAFRGQLISGLSRAPLASREVAVAVTAFVDAAGKEASEKRIRARQVLEFAVEFYTGCLRGACRADDAHESALAQAIERRLAQPVEVPGLEAALERTLAAVEHVEHNANQATLIECWLDDLARILDRHGWRELPAA
ncbi:MAG: DNA polymerase III subunit [Planctomycetia bacterium]|nr:DNA polymerase III subunit [Planctomycetia bacterium]